MACCSKLHHVLLVLTHVLSSTIGNSIITDANNRYKQQKQIDCGAHQNCFKCPINEQCNIICDASNTCHQLTIFAQYSSLLILNVDPLFVSSITIYAPPNHDTLHRIQIYKLSDHNILNLYNHEMDINIIPYTNTQRRLLTVSPTIAPTPSIKTENIDSRTGFMILLDKAITLDILWYIIAALILSICCVSCCCLYYFRRTRKASEKIKKLSIKKPTKQIAIYSANNLKSPTANTVATFSSYGSQPTASPYSDATVSYNHLQPQKTKSKSNGTPKMEHGYDQSDSVEETKETVIVHTSTIRSMDVDGIPISPNTSIRDSNILYAQNSMQSNGSGKEFAGYVMSHPNYNPSVQHTSLPSTFQSWQQQRENLAIVNINSDSHGNDNMYTNRVQANSVPFRNMNNNNNNNNNIWNNNPSYPHRSTVAVMSNVVHNNNNNNIHQVSYPRNTHQQQRIPLNNNNSGIPRNAYQPQLQRPRSQSPQYQHMQNRANDQGFRFQPQYQYQQPPQHPPQHQPQHPPYNNKVMRPQMNHDIPPPPPRKQKAHLKPDNNKSEPTLTHITSSTVASLNTADFEDDNTNSVSRSSSKTGVEHQESFVTDKTRQISYAEHIGKQETFATHTVFRSDDLDANEVGNVMDGKKVDSVIFSVPLEIEKEEDAGDYMILQRNMKHVVDTKSMFALDNQPSPEHSPNNTMVINMDRNQISSFDLDESVQSDQSNML